MFYKFKIEKFLNLLKIDGLNSNDLMKIIVLITILR